MPIVDLLVDNSTGHVILSMMVGYSGYNQICIAEKDVHKTVFRCLGNIGTFEWVKMSFGLMNAGVIYICSLNTIVHDLIVV